MIEMEEWDTSSASNWEASSSPFFSHHSIFSGSSIKNDSSSTGSFSGLSASSTARMRALAKADAQAARVRFAYAKKEKKIKMKKACLEASLDVLHQRKEADAASAKADVMESVLSQLGMEEQGEGVLGFLPIQTTPEQKVGEYINKHDLVTPFLVNQEPSQHHQLPQARDQALQRPVNQQDAFQGVPQPQQKVNSHDYVVDTSTSNLARCLPLIVNQEPSQHHQLPQDRDRALQRPVNQQDAFQGVLQPQQRVNSHDYVVDTSTSNLARCLPLIVNQESSQHHQLPQDREQALQRPVTQQDAFHGGPQPQQRVNSHDYVVDTSSSNLAGFTPLTVNQEPSQHHQLPQDRDQSLQRPVNQQDAFHGVPQTQQSVNSHDYVVDTSTSNSARFTALIVNEEPSQHHQLPQARDQALQSPVNQQDAFHGVPQPQQSVSSHDYIVDTSISEPSRFTPLLVNQEPSQHYQLPQDRDQALQRPVPQQGAFHGVPQPQHDYVVDTSISDLSSFTPLLVNQEPSQHHQLPQDRDLALQRPVPQQGAFHGVPQPQQRLNSHRYVVDSSPSDLARLLAKIQLMTGALSKFDDKPESYPSWKVAFRSIITDVGLTLNEELNLLIKWLGPESSQHATRVKAVHISCPSVALEIIWTRLDEVYGSPEAIENSLFSKIDKFPKVSRKDPRRLQELSDIISELEAAKENGHLPLSTYFDTARGVGQIVEKLPFYLQEKWIMVGSKYKEDHGVTFPPFSFFCEFMKGQAKARNDPSFNSSSFTSHAKRTKAYKNAQKRKVCK
ncbi:uncharacterized protein LOC144002733 [Festucalex cinctus]